MDSQDKDTSFVKLLEYDQPNEDISFTEQCTKIHRTQGKPNNELLQDDCKITKSDPPERETLETKPVKYVHV